MTAATLLQIGGGIIPRGTQRGVFEEMFWVFTALGAVVGVLVIGYLLWKAYQYRGGAAAADVDRPILGELPTGSDGGRHLFVSFSLSAILVVSLIVWTYGGLLYVSQSGAAQQPPADAEETMNVTVVAHQFYWEFQYRDVPGHDETLTTRNELRVPKDTAVYLRVTSADVFHNFGVPALKVKTDAVPGQNTTTWLVAHETGTYVARCYELCGTGHSYMTGTVVVTDRQSFDEWYANQTSNSSAADNQSSVEATGPADRDVVRGVAP